MLLNPVALAWSSWLGLSVGIVGLLVSAIGLTLTFREASRATRSAEQARLEVKRVVALVISRNRIATLASGVSQIDLLLAKVKNDTLGSSPESLTPLRRSLVEARIGTRSDEFIENGRLDMALDDLTSVEKLIWSDLEEKAKKAQMAVTLQKVRNSLMELEVLAKLEELA